MIHTCIDRFVRNQRMKLPSGGIMCGYCFVFWVSISGAESGGPGYCRGGARFRRAGWDGGLNFAGFSRTRGFDEEAFEAYRHSLRHRSTRERALAEPAFWRCNRGPPCGSNQRGIVAAIVFWISERLLRIQRLRCVSVCMTTGCAPEHGEA